MDNNEIKNTENQLNQTIQPDETQAPEGVLSQRQIEILQEKGLPTNYEELTPSQKKAIMAIEEMMSATEAKYGLELCFVSYGTDSWGGTDDSLIVYPANGIAELDSFEILRSRDGQITDNYIHIQTQRLFEKYIQDHAETVLGESTAKVYATVTQVGLETIPGSKAEIPHNVDGFWLVFVDGAAVTEEAFEQFVENYAAWKQENGFTGSAQLILMKEGVHIYLTQFNYMDYLTEEYYLQRCHCNN